MIRDDGARPAARPGRRRGGLTLVELLVCVALIGLLVGLLLPAVQSAREANRRLDCLEHVRSLNLATQNFHQAANHYPQGMRPDGVRGSHLFAAVPPLAAHVLILPYLERMDLFNAINLARPSTVPPGGIADSPGAYSTAMTVAVAPYLCPSDGARGDQGTSYRFCVGPRPYMNDATPWPGGGGAFPALGTIHAADVTDGLSQTIAISERCRGAQGTSFDRDRDIAYSSLSSVRRPVDADDMAEACRALAGQVVPFESNAGSTWLVAGLRDTLYNHVATPNGSEPDCSVDGPDYISGGAISARSRHPGGVHCGLLDGSARFVADGIALAAWRALATRSGGEVFASDF